MILHIAFQGGTHGHFLRYFLDKFSLLTPKLDSDPTTDVGTYHKEINYSGKFEIYHPNLETRDLSLPHCVITVSNNDILHLQRTVYTRPKDMDLDLTKDYVIFKNTPKNFDEKSIEALYGITVNENTKVPKFIVRDFIKLGFSDLDNHGYISENRRIMKQPFQNVYFLPVSSFWNEQKFFEQMKMLDTKFDLQLSLDSEAKNVHHKLINNIPQLNTADRCTKIISAIKNKEEMVIDNIDLIEEAYIYSWIETQYRNILTPFTNTFFKNTKEIIEYIEWYPHFYHGMNPTLPKGR